MSHAQSFYDRLGVDPEAAPHVIRAAYIAMMKQHHPNSPYRENADTDGDAQAITTAYSVLKDPDKRAAYDASLRGQRRDRLPAPRQIDPRLLAAGNRHPPQRARHDRLAWLILTIAVSVVAAQRLIGHDGSSDYQAIAGSLGAPAVAASHSLYEVPPPHETAWIQRQAELAASMAVGDAAAFSSRCFKEAGAVGTPAAAEQCIVFDLAFAYWRQGESGGPSDSAYFQPDMVQRRQSEALAQLDPDQALLRLDSLRAETFSTLLDMADPLSSTRHDVSGDEAGPAGQAAGGIAPGAPADRTTAEPE